MMQPEPVVSSSPNSVGGGGSNKDDSACTAAGMAAAAVAAAVEDSQQLALSCANSAAASAAASGSGNFIPNHPQHSQYKGRKEEGGLIWSNAECSFRFRGQFERKLFALVHKALIILVQSELIFTLENPAQ